MGLVREVEEVRERGLTWSHDELRNVVGHM